MINRKAILANINGKIYVDPSDVERMGIEAIKSSIRESFKKDMPIVVEPIHEWMPKSGIKALMNEALNDLGIGKKIR